MDPQDTQNERMINMYLRDWNDKYGTSYVPYGMEVIELGTRITSAPIGRIAAVPIGTAVPNGNLSLEILDGIRAVIWIEALQAWVLPTRAVIDNNFDAMVRYSTIRLNERKQG